MTFVEKNIRAFHQWVETHSSLPFWSDKNQTTLIEKIRMQHNNPEMVSEIILEWCESNSAIDEELAQIRDTFPTSLEISKGFSSEPPKGEQEAVNELVQNLIRISPPATENSSNQTLPNKEKT